MKVEIKENTSSNIIEIQTKLTTQILISYPDNTFDLNIYGRAAKFVAEARIIDQNKKSCTICKFISKEPFDMNTVNIHELWLAFDKKVAELIPNYLDKFVDSHECCKAIPI